MTAPFGFDANPRPLCPDPQLGTRVGYKWCAECGGIKEPGHDHGDEAAAIAARQLTLEQARAVALEYHHMHLARRAEQKADKDRAEFAESLLCAMAFDHWLKVANGMCWASLVPPEYSGCVFCEAAR